MTDLGRRNHKGNSGLGYKNAKCHFQIPFPYHSKTINKNTKYYYPRKWGTLIFESDIGIGGIALALLNLLGLPRCKVAPPF